MTILEAIIILIPGIIGAYLFYRAAQPKTDTEKVGRLPHIPDERVPRMPPFPRGGWATPRTQRHSSGGIVMLDSGGYIVPESMREQLRTTIQAQGWTVDHTDHTIEDAASVAMINSGLMSKDEARHGLIYKAVQGVMKEALCLYCRRPHHGRGETCRGCGAPVMVAKNERGQ